MIRRAIEESEREAKLLQTAAQEQPSDSGAATNSAQKAAEDEIKRQREQLEQKEKEKLVDEKNEQYPKKKNISQKGLRQTKINPTRIKVDKNVKTKYQFNKAKTLYENSSGPKMD